MGLFSWIVERGLALGAGVGEGEEGGIEWPLTRRRRRSRGKEYIGVRAGGSKENMLIAV